MENCFKYENIKGLHLELTTKCNAMCPMCNRNFRGRVRKKLPIIELSLDDIKKILNPDFIKQLELISICGVYGDPICNKYLKSILNYLYECNCNIDIDVYTNGDLYDNDWWENLAITHKNHNFTVIFGIDGIGEIHSLHRCNTNYDKIISHAISFINNGGKAKWDYIVFKHNEHQVEEAREISKKLGFQEFQIKKTSRFLKNIYESDAALDSTISEYGKHPVFDNKGNIDYYIELPNKSIYRNESEKKASELKEKYGTFLEYLNKVEIICKEENEAKKLNKILQKNGINSRYISNKDSEYSGGIFVLTSSSSKGLEFDAVIIKDASKDIYMSESDVDMHLLYVASTRALHELEILYDNDITSVYEDKIRENKVKTLKMN